jgi:ABC-type multidrug transport system fused ATPase/permease subunit
MASMTRARERQEWAFAAALRRAAPGLATAWWVLLVLRGLLPPLLAVAGGTLVGAVERGDRLAGPLVFVGAVFIGFQVLSPLHQAVSANLGSRTGSWLNDQLLTSATAPPGMGHLEDPELMNDLSMARDFDLGISGPPLSIAMDFIATGLVQMVGGLAAASVLFAFEWWAPIVLIAGWAATHWMLRESGVWKDRNTDEVRTAQRHAEYAYRLAVDAPAAKELRLFGLSDWVVDRFRTRRHRLYELQWNATRLREKSVLGCLVVVTVANVAVFWPVAVAAADGRISLAAAVVFLQSAFGASLIAFGGLSWALDGAAAPVAAVMRLRATMAAAGALTSGPQSADEMPQRDVRFRDVTFGYSTSATPVLSSFDLTVPAGTSVAIVGQNGAGKTTLAKLLCRLYDPQSGAIEIDGVDLRDLDIGSWRRRVTAVFQDFVRYELSLRDNVAPNGAPDDVILAALADAGAHEVLARLDGLDTVLAKGYERGTELSGGQWQRIALARTLCAVRQGAGLVLLDEPTAQLDVRGESEIFERVLAATRHVTTVLVSHRFSTVRLADRICVVEGGRVVELGAHAELIERGGRYATMFDLQASRFVEVDESGREVVYEQLR